VWVASTYDIRDGWKADEIVHMLNIIMTQLRGIINMAVKQSVWTDYVQEWRHANGIQKRFFKLGSVTFATFDDVREKYKANPSPYFHNAVAQAA
jgi:hypothetical protein